MNSKLLALLLLAMLPAISLADQSAHVVFVAGDAKVAGRTARTGDPVQTGELLTTSQDGYLYLQTKDNGFFILRPNSTGQIVSYQIDSVNPANTRIKIELKAGVARHISGTAVKNARQNFRFNTPVAAIGVRGTDFTVFASQDTTRISVLSGGVVVSPFTTTCTSGSYGPCEGNFSKELFATLQSQALQVKRDQVPILLQGADQTPDAVLPPRPDEPKGATKSNKGQATAADAVALSDLDLSHLAPLKSDLINQLGAQLQGGDPALGTPKQLIWGRWQPVLDQAVQIDVAALQATHQLIATNRYHALTRDAHSDWQKPVANTIGFSLAQSEAFIHTAAASKVVPAQLENGQLEINFGTASFFTKFDLVSLNERFLLQNTGEVSKDGRLYGGNQFLRPNNMDVRGALAANNSTAAYLFQARLDDGRTASGVAGWGR